MVSVTPDKPRGWLDVLEPDRRAHSLEVGRKVQSVQTLVDQGLREDLVTAATLHDIGYGYPDTGFHPLDGARLLAREGFSPVVCSLVLRHSASMMEAEERGLDLAVYGEFVVDQNLVAAHQLVWWADMTTGPTGETVTVEDRLDEICARYGPGNVVTRFISRARPILLASCQAPGGSIQLSE